MDKKMLEELQKMQKQIADFEDRPSTLGDGLADLRNNKLPVNQLPEGVITGDVTADNVDSGAATEGQVLTANGEGGATWQDAEDGLPEITAGDEGKVLKVDSGAAVWAEAGSGGSIAVSNTDTFGKYIIKSDNLIELPNTITIDSTINDIIALDLGITVPSSGADEYLIKFASPLESNKPAIMKLTFIPYGLYTISLQSDYYIENKAVVTKSYDIKNGSAYQLDTPISQWSSKITELYNFFPACDETPETSPASYSLKCIVNHTGPNTYSYGYYWQKD